MVNGECLLVLINLLLLLRILKCWCRYKSKLALYTSSGSESGQTKERIKLKNFWLIWGEIFILYLCWILKPFDLLC